MTETQAENATRPRLILREWLPGTIVAVLLLLIARLLESRSLIGSLFPGDRELFNFCFVAAFGAAFCLGGYTFTRAVARDVNVELARRTAIACFFGIIGCKIGTWYIHLCLAGSRWIEGTAMLGTPLLVFLSILLVKPRWLAYVLAIVILIAVGALARPYLDWAHGY